MNERRAYILMVFSIPILWGIAVKASGLPAFVIPPPSLVAKVLIEVAGEFWFHTRATLEEAFAGYLIANVISLTLAVSFLYLPEFESFITPWMVLIRNIPFVTIASIMVITLGSDSPIPKLVIVVLITFYPILANVIKGLKSVDPVLLDRMEVLHASKWQVFIKVRWPTALPYYVAANEISFTASIIGAIAGEWLFAKRGLGFVIVRALMQYRADRLYAATLISSVLSVGAYILVKAIERWLFRWKADIRD